MKLSHLRALKLILCPVDEMLHVDLSVMECFKTVLCNTWSSGCTVVHMNECCPVMIDEEDPHPTPYKKGDVYAIYPSGLFWCEFLLLGDR